MKHLISTLTILTIALIGTLAFAQSPKTVRFVQTPGEFTTSGLTLKPGTYTFEVTNDNATDEVGFVLVQKGKDPANPKNHIKEAYVSKTAKKGTTEKTGVIKLEKGEYVYFCPLNKTPHYPLTVK